MSKNIKNNFNRLLSTIVLVAILCGMLTPFGQAANLQPEEIEPSPLASQAPQKTSTPPLGFPNGGLGTGGRIVEDYDGPTSNIPPSFHLEAFDNLGHGHNGLNVRWPAYPFGTERYELGFLYYQRMKNSDGSWTQWETRSTHAKRPLNVLIISPSNATSNSAIGITRRVEGWLNQPDVDPDGLLNVRTVTARMFAEGRWPATADSNTAPPIHPDGPNHILIDSATGRHRFDVIIIGTADLNGGAIVGSNFDSDVLAALNGFLDSGRGILFGHDTFFDRGSNVTGTAATLPGLVGAEAVTNWNYQLAPMADRAGIIATTRVGRFAHRTTSTQASMRVEMDGVLTQYPNRVVTGQVLPVPRTHNNAAATRGTVWARITDRSGALGTDGTPSASAITTNINNGILLPESTTGNLVFMHDGHRYQTNAYLSTYRNTAHIQTGHTASGTTQAERRIIANTVFFLSQLTFDNSFVDRSAMDWEPPIVDEPFISSFPTDGSNIHTVRIYAEDQGTVYQGRISAIPQGPDIQGLPDSSFADDEGRFRSHVYEETVKSGTRGYFVSVGGANIRPTVPVNDYGEVQYESTPGTTVLMHTESEGADFSMAIDWNNVADQYIHIIAVDYANNISEMRSIPLDNLRVGVEIEVVEESPVGSGNFIPVQGANLDIVGVAVVNAGLTGKVFVPISEWGVFPIIASAQGFDMEFAYTEVWDYSRLDKVRIVMTRGDRVLIWGQVRDFDTNAPIANATVTVPSLRYDTTGNVVEGATYNATTDRFGFYRIYGRGTGTYTAIAEADGYNAEAAMIHILTNDAVRQDFWLKSQPPYNVLVFGVVRDTVANGSALPNVAVTVGGVGTTTDSWGFYAASIPRAGNEPAAAITGSLFGFGDYHNPNVVLAPLPASVSRHDFTMTQSQGVFVEVEVLHADTGIPLANASVDLFGITLMTDANGIVTFRDIPVGRSYHILAQIAGFNPNTTQVTVPPNAVLGSIIRTEIRLHPGNLGAIRGRVLCTETNAGVSGATVRTAVGGANPLHQTITDDWGFYVIIGVQPGTYTMIVSHPDYNSAAHLVQVHPNLFSEQDFWITPHKNNPNLMRHIVEGYVRNDMNPPSKLQNATVRVDGTGRQAVTDSFGYYVLTGFTSDGVYNLIAFSHGFANDSREITMAKEDREENFILRSTVWINIVGVAIDENPQRELYKMSMPLSAAAGLFNVSAPHMTGLVVQGESVVQVDPSIFPNNGIIQFNYINNMTTVTIKAQYIMPETDGPSDVELPNFVSFEIPAEIGSTFTFTGNIPQILGLQFAGMQEPIIVQPGGSSVFYLYYLTEWANMLIEAREYGSKNMLTTSGVDLSIDGTVNITDIGYDYISGDITKVAVAMPLEDGDTREAIFYGIEAESLRFFNLKQGYGEFEGHMGNSFTFNGVGTPPVMVFYFERIMATANIVLMDAQTNEIIAPVNPIASIQVPMGIPHNVSAPEASYVPRGYILAPGQESRTIAIMNVDETEITIAFLYNRTTDARDVTVEAIGIDIDGSESIIGQFAIVGVVGEYTTADAPDFAGAGWLLQASEANPTPGSVLVTEDGPNVIRFYYARDIVTVSIEARHYATNVLLTQIIAHEVVRGSTQTFTAPHISGYVINGSGQQTLVSITEDDTIVFTYIPIEEFVDDFTVVLMVVGRAGETELYRYTVVRGRNSGEYTVKAFEPSGFSLADGAANTHTFNVGEIPLTHYFEYESLATQVEIRAVDAVTGNLIPGFTPFYMPAILGQPFSCFAPHVPNFNLVGDLNQTIENVSLENNVMTFKYESAIGNLTIVLREVDAEGNLLGVIRTEGKNLDLNVQTTIIAPDLGVDFFVLVSDAFVEVTFTGVPLVVEFDYVKHLVSVTIRAINNLTDEVLDTWMETGIRVGEVSTFHARPVEGFALRDTTPRLVQVTEANQIIDFYYEPATDDQVIVEAVLYEGGVYTIIYSYVITSRTGSTVTVSAPTLLGFALSDPLNAVQTVTVPGNIKFVYVRDEVTVTVNLVNHSTGAELTAPVGFQTTIQVPRGGDVTVFAPHLSGFVIEGVQSASFTRLMENDEVIFSYLPIDGYTLIVNVLPDEAVSGAEVHFIGITMTNTESNRWELNFSQQFSGRLEVTSPGFETYSEEIELVFTDGVATVNVRLQPIAPTMTVTFVFDDHEVAVPVKLGQIIDPTLIPTPATRYGMPGVPGEVLMGWYTEIFHLMHYINNPERATAFDLTQPITADMFGENSKVLYLYASWLQYGDVNGDGVVDTRDLTLLQRVLMGLGDEFIMLTAQVAVNGVLDARDLTLLQRALMGMPDAILGIPHPNQTFKQAAESGVEDTVPADTEAANDIYEDAEEVCPPEMLYDKPDEYDIEDDTDDVVDDLED